MKRDIRTDHQLLLELRSAVTDLKRTSPWPGFIRFVSLGAITLGLAGLSWHAATLSGFVLGAIATSIFYTFWLVCNHDAIHRTLTGWKWFDALMPRLIAWPIGLPLGTYGQLHRLHHKYNGIDLKDPERIQWADAEYRAAPGWQRWYVRHQWPIDIVVFGSIGLIVKTIRHGLKQADSSPHLPAQMIVDLLGVLSLQTVILSFLYLQSASLWRYLMFLFILERGVGVMMQTREHLEHYGLWQQMDSYPLTQLYACRNIETFPWVNWLMGGLPYHGIHHAFPQIPTNHLPEAFHRVQAVLQQHQLPAMTFDSGYVLSSLRLGQHYSLIETGPPETGPREIGSRETGLHPTTSIPSAA